jgi:hypothetical protein
MLTRRPPEAPVHTAPTAHHDIARPKGRLIAGLGLVLTVLGCTSAIRKGSAPSKPATSLVGTKDFVLNGRSQALTDWIYDVTASPGATELRVEARFPAGVGVDIGNDEEVATFIHDLCLVTASGCEPLVGGGPTWSVARCETEGCKLRYRFALADAASALRDPDLAVAYDGIVVAPPSTWLIRPLGDGPITSYRLHVTTARGEAFATGVPSIGDELGTFRGSTGDLPLGPYSGFGRLHITQKKMGASVLEVARGPGDFDAGLPRISAWIDGAAQAVGSYFRHFPSTHALLLVVPEGGAGLGYGKALGNGGASMFLPIGRRTTAREFDDDWVLVHEMLHLGFPSLPRQHIWLAEGIATYVEPLARARSGQMSTAAAWKGLVDGMPNGLPEANDRGLDSTHTWGRTYWGGALFCLVVDVAIRERTNNTRSLDDALRAVADEGGTIAARWDIARFLEVADRAIGMPVVSEFYRSMALARQDVDLPRLWQRLGIQKVGRSIAFDDGAPLAAIRTSLTARYPHSSPGDARPARAQPVAEPKSQGAPTR